MPGAFWLFGGCNGAGKSTFIENSSLLGGAIAGVRILNPDHLTKELLEAQGYRTYQEVPPDVYQNCFRQAASKMEADAKTSLEAGGTVCIETVLSTKKYLPLVQIALNAGSEFNFLYVTLASPELSRQRIAIRVSRGGHPVPDDKIEPRFRRSWANMKTFVKLATRFWLYDNSDSTVGSKPKLLIDRHEQNVHVYEGLIYDRRAVEIIRAVTAD